MNVKFSDFASGTLNSTSFIVGYDSSTNSNVRISKSTLDSAYQPTLVSGTNIKTINGTSVLGSGNLVVSGTQVGYRGFKYNIGTGTDFPSPSVPLAGQAILLFDGDETFQGMTISPIDADGNSTSDYLSRINGQPITVVNADNSKTIVIPNSVTFVAGANPYFYVISNNFNYVTVTGVAYIDFNTSNALPAYSGYSMAGNLNGTSIAVGTSYLGIGSSTAGSTISSRSFRVNTPQRRVTNCTITTAGVMTGSMSIRLFAEGSPIGIDTVLAAGTAAGTYEFVNTLNLPNTLSNLTIRITQSTATSCGINGFSLILA